MRSAKMMLTTLRPPPSSVWVAGATSAAPQASQNCASGSLSLPHVGQRGASVPPQPPQKRAPARFVLPQCTQFMATSLDDQRTATGGTHPDYYPRMISRDQRPADYHVPS